MDHLLNFWTKEYILYFNHLTDPPSKTSVARSLRHSLRAPPDGPNRGIGRGPAGKGRRQWILAGFHDVIFCREAQHSPSARRWACDRLPPPAPSSALSMSAHATTTVTTRHTHKVPRR